MGFYCHLVYYAQLPHFGMVGIGSSQDGRRQPLGYLLVFGGMQCFLVCGQLNWNAIGFAGIFWRWRWGIVLLIIIPLLVCARHATSFDIRWASASHRTAVASLNGLGAGCKGSSVQRSSTGRSYGNAVAGVVQRFMTRLA